jgi:membrane protein implicated in regulation of membrane protease activity
MPDFLTNLSALTVFLGIAAVGFLFLVVSLAFGELFEGHGGDHAFDADGPGFFSPQVLSVFVTAFGGIGAIAVYQGSGVVAASAFGTLGGVVLAWLVYLFARFLYGQQASSQITAADLVGRTAEVTVQIPARGTGRVRLVVGETAIDKLARARDGAELPFNSLVKIDDVAGESVIVSPLADATAAAAADTARP